MQVTQIPLVQIAPDPEQPRKWFNKEELENLAANIGEHGVLEPILVRPEGESYIIIAGERRWRASSLAGKSTIPAIIRTDMGAHQLEEVSISENTSRQDLNPVEEARAFAKLRDRGQTLPDICRKVGKSAGFVEGRLSILTLDPDIVRLVETGQMGATSAISIARLPRTHQHLGLRAVAEGITDAALRVFVDDVLARMAEIQLFDTEQIEERSREAIDLRARVERAIDLSLNAIYALVDKKHRVLLPAAFKGDFGAVNEKLAILEREVRWVRQLMNAAAVGAVVSDEEIAAHMAIAKVADEEVPA